MKLFSFKAKFGEIKTRLTEIGENEPLSKMSLIAIIFLDIFILVTIFVWLEDHTRQISTIDQYIPYKCQNFIIDADQKFDSEKIRLVKEELNLSSFSYPVYNDYVKEGTSFIHPICLSLNQKLDTISWSINLIALFKNLSDNEETRNKLQYELNDIKQNYDTAILEKIATNDTNITDIKQKRESKIAELNKIENNIKEINGKILQDKDYIDLWNFVLGDNFQKIKTLEKDLQIAYFWFPIKKLLMEFAFLIPLFMIFWIWNSYSIKKNNWTQSLISSHLIVITFIPIFWKIVETVLDIIPKKLLEKIMEFLASFKLLAIWYYIVVFVGIMFWLGAVYIIQKKIFSKEKLEERRLSRWECYKCGKHIPDNIEHCPFCSANQFRTCGICQKKTNFTSKYCIQCWWKI